MAFKVLDEQPLTAAERECLREFRLRREIGTRSALSSNPTPLITKRQSLGIIGGTFVAASASPLLIPSSSHAADPLNLLVAIIEGSIDLLKTLLQIAEKIKAVFTLVNDLNKEQFKPVNLRVESSSVGLTDNDFANLKIPAGTKRTIEHSGFNAKETGDNSYIVKTQLSEKASAFRVIS